MGLQQKKRDDLDKLFEDLGVLDLPDGVEVPFHDKWSEPAPLTSEDPYARFLAKSETGSENSGKEA